MRIPASLIRYLSHTNKAGRVAGVYLVFTSLWIFASDRLLRLVLDDPELMIMISSAKGFAFVVVTTLLLYLLLRFWGEARLENASQPTSPPRPYKLIALSFGLMLIVPLVAFSIVHLQTPHIQDATFADLRSISQFKVKQIESWLAERQGDAQVLANSVWFFRQAEQYALTGNAAARNNVLSGFEEFFAAYRLTNGFSSAILLNASGQALLAIGEYRDAPDLIKRQLLPAALKSGQVQRSDLYRDAAGHIHLDYVVPLSASPGNPQKITTVVVLHAPVDLFLFPLIQTWPTHSPSAESLLVRRDGDHVLFLNELRHSKSAALTLRPPLSTAFS